MICNGKRGENVNRQTKQEQLTEEVRGDTKTFLSGVCILSLSTVLVKILGLASKIPLIAKLGAEGMGYFNSAYELYALLCVISTAGLPTALSMLVSGEERETEKGWIRIRHIFRCGFSVFLLIGGVGTVCLFVGAKPLSELIESPNARFCILAIAPALLFVCIASAVRGYFQGLRNMTPTAVSQLIEAVGKLLFGIFFADQALKRGAKLPVAAAWAVLGVSLGCLLSAVYLLLSKWRESVGSKKGNCFTKFTGKTQKDVVKRLLKIAVPITLSSAVISMSRLVDMTMMIRRLQDLGLTVADANRIYGAYTTMAVPVFSLLPSLIAPISMALIPQLNIAVGRGSLIGQKTSIETSCRLTVLFSMPASMGIILFAKPILGMLFSSESESILLCAPLLSVLGMSVLFSGLITTTNAILQAYRKVGLPILSMSVGLLIKIVSSYLLMGIPQIGAMGAPISTFFCNVTVVLMNLLFISNHAGTLEIGFGKLLLRPVIPSLAAVLGAFALYLPIFKKVGERPALMLAICLALLLYGGLSLWMGVIRQEDLRFLPLGEKIIKKIKREP